MNDDAPYCLIVQPQDDDPSWYEARWASYEPGRDDDRFCSGIAEVHLDLAPFMIARGLMERMYDPSRTLVVKLYGSDRTMLCAPLGAAAATPIVNFGTPVKEPTRHLYWKTAS